MPKLYCYSFNAFNRICAENNWNDDTMPDGVAFISILCTDDVISFYGFENHECHFASPHDSVCVVRFDDITDDRLRLDNGGYACGLDIAQAKQLVQFIDSHAGDDIYVHCMAGKSRSQGVVRYILDTYWDIYNAESLNPDNPCLYPNMDVVVKLKRAYNEMYFE